jgi:hypothetical protein
MLKITQLCLLLLTLLAVLSQRALGQDTESVKSCEAKWGHSKDDCYCGGGGHEVGRGIRQIGATKLLEIHYETGPEPLISHEGHDFGCWYLTTVVSPPGYRLLGVGFTSNTSTGGKCQLSDSIDDKATDISSFVKLRWHGTPETYEDPHYMNSQDYQECQIYKRSPKEVEFKWRLKGQEGARDNWQVNEKGLQYTREQLKDKVKGLTVFNLWFVPNP